VAEDLRQAMTQNPHLKVFVANGYYDLATPFYATEYTVDHMGLDPTLRKNVEFGYYESGHMIYLHLPALKALKADLARFYGETSGQ
jgi:carboxypeptidase C (cathepsin A)